LSTKVELATAKTKLEDASEKVNEYKTELKTWKNDCEKYRCEYENLKIYEIFYKENISQLSGKAGNKEDVKLGKHISIS